MKIAIVVPVYREARNLPRLYAALSAVIDTIRDYEWSVVFVNDGSSDESLDVLRKLAARDARVGVIDLSRNFGKEIALTAGVHACINADAVICMDADLQHPPELIPDLIAAWKNGAEIVATIRKSIERQPLLRRIGSHGYYWLMSKISGLDMQSQTTDFRLFDKKVVRAFCRATERERMFRGISGLARFSQSLCGIPRWGSRGGGCGGTPMRNYGNWLLIVLPRFHCFR